MRKFIITSEGNFRYGDVRMHKDLLLPRDICLGGGYYEFDYVSNRLLLSGKSFDYGKPKWHYAYHLLVPQELRGLTILYEGEPLLLEVKYV
ncbi:MAG: hypothetical protein HUK12_05930 [Muribaculaceae bacterium]|mgnify:CR=1 FL=1|nr:hypothetical protein [Muribaculaceae bacterium]